ncbi:MAG: hypothetical protein LBB56_07060 [Chitinispirillales bacterium]|jgi:hypothetical protein|nr:hypothetical protein [Chitinispirillales bacterium]
MKTIKQVADELGISKDKIKYQVRKLPGEYIQKTGNVTYINSDGVHILRERVGNLPGKAKGNNPLLTNDLPTVYPLYEMLQQELETKNKLIDNMRADHVSAIESLRADIIQERQSNREQIADLTAALVATQQTAATAQALHAGTLQQQLTSSNGERDDDELDVTVVKHEKNENELILPTDNEDPGKLFSLEHLNEIELYKLTYMSKRDFNERLSELSDEQLFTLSQEGSFEAHKLYLKRQKSQKRGIFSLFSRKS